MAFEGFCDDGTHSRNPRGGERSTYHVRGREAEEPFHLGCARESDGIHTARLQALQQLMYSLVVGRIGVHVRGDHRHSGAGALQKIDEPLIRLRTVELKPDTSTRKRLAAEACDDAVCGRRLRSE